MSSHNTSAVHTHSQTWQMFRSVHQTSCHQFTMDVSLLWTCSLHTHTHTDSSSQARGDRFKSRQCQWETSCNKLSTGLERHVADNTQGDTLLAQSIHWWASTHRQTHWCTGMCRPHSTAVCFQNIFTASKPSLFSKTLQPGEVSPKTEQYTGGDGDVEMFWLVVTASVYSNEQASLVASSVVKIFLKNSVLCSRPLGHLVWIRIYYIDLLAIWPHQVVGVRFRLLT